MLKIKAIRPQASFLIFLDCRELGFATQAELDHFFVDKAKLALNSGDMFGIEGKGFMRMNIAVSRTVLEKAMTQLQKAYDDYKS
jgi:cystathionine beta-lyase